MTTLILAYMPKVTRNRLDYMPGDAAYTALVLAAEMFPNLRTQALIDKLLITGVSALCHQHWKPPGLYGKDRDKWRLPADLVEASDIEKESINMQASR